MIILENETFFTLWTRAGCGNLSKLSGHIYFHILSVFLIQSWFNEKSIKLKYTQCLFIQGPKTNFSPYYPWGSDDNWNIVTNLRPVQWQDSWNTGLGLVSREWSLSNAETCLSCQVWAEAGGDQPSKRSKLSTWKLDSNPAIEICSWDASQYTATAIHQINQNCVVIKTNRLLFTQNWIQLSTHFAQSEFKLSASLSDHSSLCPAPPAVDNWLGPGLLCPDHTSTHQTTETNLTRLRGIHIFVKINLSPEREEENAVNTNMP